VLTLTVLIFSALCMVSINTPAGEKMPLSAENDTGKKLYVIGHRGAAGLAPENTLAAFTRALELGVDGIELDVLMTADGKLVVHHDYRLKPEIARTPNSEWVKKGSSPVIMELSLAELRTFDVGRLNPHTTYAGRYPQQQPVDGERIPTLREVVQLLKSKPETNTQLYVEIKTSPRKPKLTPPPEEIATAVVKLLDEENVTDRTLIESFDWRSLFHVQKIAPSIRLVFLSSTAMRHNTIRIGMPGPSPWTAGLDIDDYDGSIPRLVKAAGGRFWAPRHNQVMNYEIEAAHRLGIKVFVWTVDRRADMIRFMEMGVDGIITNRPDILLNSVLKR
jgi:glycerophosphoryl diester phosphodiesterase